MRHWGRAQVRRIAVLALLAATAALPAVAAPAPSGRAAAGAAAAAARLTVAGNARSRAPVGLSGSTVEGVVWVSVAGAGPQARHTLTLDHRRLGVARGHQVERIDTRRLRDGAHTLTASEPGRQPLTASFTVTNRVPAASLIQTALSLHELDYGTSLVDRMYAMWGNAILPKGLRGTGPGQDEGLYSSADDALRRHLIGGGEAAALKRYLIRPAAVGSALAPLHGRHVAAGADGPDPNSCDLAGGWATATAGKFVRVFVSKSHPGATPLATQIAGVADAALTPETKDLGDPIGDHGQRNCKANPDDRVDLYLVDPEDAIARGSIIPGTTPGKPWPASGQTADTSAVQEDANRCFSYILLNRDAVAPGGVLDVSALQDTLVHELYHVLQSTHDCFLNSWFVEASAEWAETHYLGSTGVALGRNRYYFAKFQAAQPRSLEVNCRTCNPQSYENWIFALFMDQQGVSPSTVWRSLSTERTADDGIRAIDSHLNLASQFRQFALRDLNLSYHEPDGTAGTMFSDAVPVGAANPPTGRMYAYNLPLTNGSNATREMAVPANLEARYVHLTTDPAVRYVTLDFSAAGPDVDADALAHVVGQPDLEHRVMPGGKLSYCLDNPKDNFDSVFVVLSNHAITASNAYAKDFTFSTKDHCPSTLTGTINYTITNTSNACSDPTQETGCSYQQTINGTAQINLVPAPGSGESSWIDNGGSWSGGVSGSSTVTELSHNPPTPSDGCYEISNWSGGGTDDTKQASVNYDPAAGTVSNMLFGGTNQDTGTWTTASTTSGCHDPTLDGSDTSTTTDFLWSGDLDAYGCQDAWPVAMVNGQPTTVTIDCSTSGPSYDNTTQTFTAHGTLTFGGT